MIALSIIIITALFIAMLINAYLAGNWFKCTLLCLMIFANVSWFVYTGLTTGLQDGTILVQPYKVYKELTQNSKKEHSTEEKSFDKKQEEKEAQKHNTKQKREAEWVCTIVDNQKICTRQEDEAREDKTSEWDCVTEGNRRICTRHGAGQKWY